MSLYLRKGLYWISCQKTDIVRRHDLWITAYRNQKRIIPRQLVDIFKVTQKRTWSRTPAKWELWSIKKIYNTIVNNSQKQFDAIIVILESALTFMEIATEVDVNSTFLNLFASPLSEDRTYKLFEIQVTIKCSFLEILYR